MKPLKYIVTFFLLAGLSACGSSKNNRQVISGGRPMGRDAEGAVGTVDANTSSAMQEFTGTVLSNNENDFNYQIRGLISSFMNSGDPTLFGHVSAQYNDPRTGFFFKGRVELSGTTFTPSRTNYNHGFALGAPMHIRIIDSLTGQTGPSGQTNISIDIPTLILQDGYINGKTVNLTFRYYSGSGGQGTYYGQVMMEGEYDSQWFYGRMYYENALYWDGRTPGAPADELGYFYIPVCDFLTCS